MCASTRFSLVLLPYISMKYELENGLDNGKASFFDSVKVVGFGPVQRFELISDYFIVCLELS
jgi:hypothetical protein